MSEIRIRHGRHRHHALALAALFHLLLLGGVRARADEPLSLVLPTRNQALFTGPESDFYMYVARNYGGKTTYPWQGGKYGFVRNPKQTSAGLVYTRFHEGVDIRPVRRDANGEPLDTVHAIGSGKVVHLSNTSSHSNYGRYVVVEHDWGSGPFYSLYAHLMSISARPGQKVGPGTPLGRLGYTGAGIDRTRAHVHLELNLLLHSDFGKWHDRHYRDPNYHGAYNGLNMVGIDIAGLFKKHKANPKIELPDFIGGMQPYYKVTAPGKLPEIAKRYPWLLRGGKSGSAWEITFSASGVPLAVEAAESKPAAPYVNWVKPSSTSHSYLTNGRLSGSGSKATLSSSGSRYIQLIMGTF